MKVSRLSALALVIGAAAGPAFALENYVLYDDFNTLTMNASRWSATEHVRIAEANVLRLVQREWGSTSSDAGSQTFNWGENIARPGPVTQMRANLRVSAIDMAACAPNPSTTQVRARMIGSFFNSGNRVAGNLTGDVLAQVNVYRNSDSVDAPGVLRVNASVFMCDSSDCNTGGSSIGFADLGTIKVDVNTLLQIEWDRANKRFLFVRDQGTPSVVPYHNLNDSSSPGNDFKSVATRMTVPNCASAPRAFGSIEAKFDNVAVNLAAKP